MALRKNKKSQDNEFAQYNNPLLYTNTSAELTEIKKKLPSSALTPQKLELLSSNLSRFCDNNLSSYFFSALTEEIEGDVMNGIFNGNVSVGTTHDLPDLINSVKEELKKDMAKSEMKHIRIKDGTLTKVEREFSKDEGILKNVLENSGSVYLQRIEVSNLNHSADLFNIGNMRTSQNRLERSNINENSDDAELKDFFNRLKEQKQKLRIKRRKRWQKQKEKIQKEFEDEERTKNERMKLKHEELLKRREIIEQNLQKRKELLHSRHQSVDESHNRLMLSESKPLFIKFEENYKNNYLLPELDRGREILKKRKEYMKQITNSELIDHEK